MAEKSPKSLRWLVVGHGRAARCHIAAIRLARNAELVGVVVRRPTDVSDMPCFLDITEAIEKTRPDAVVIATPNDHHVAAATAALSADIPVLCEKPVGRTAAEAEAILRLARARGIPAGVVLNQRACRHHAWIRERIATGEFVCRSANLTINLPRLGGWNAAQTRAGGGVLKTVGLHYLDLLCWWFGQPTWLAASMGGGPADDVAHLVLRFAAGMQASLTVTAVGEQYLSPPLMLLQADSARIRVLGHTITEVSGLPDPPAPEPTPEGLLFGPGHLAVIQTATDRLRAGQDFPLSLAEAMPILRLLDDIYAATGGVGSMCEDRAG